MSDAEEKMPANANPLYRNVLEHVASGILSIDTNGIVTTFNEAAAEICNMSEEAVVGRGFFEVFSEENDADEFVDVIFSAVYDSSTVHQCMVEATLGGRKRSLSMATRFLEDERDGETVRVGVVAMFNDISEIRELREAELKLARELESKHAELREAYLDLEETNRQLSKAAQKINVVRLVAAIAVPILFVAMGLYFWDSGAPVASTPSAPSASTALLAPEGSRTLTVTPQRLTSTLTLLGSLAPRREIKVVSPMQGKIEAVHVRPGQRVSRGQALVDMDISEVLIRQREAQVAYLKASEAVEKLEDWTGHADVLRAQRAVSKSRLAAESRKSRLAETTFLLERGIIPASEHKAAEREHRNQQLDLRAAEHELQAVLERGASELKVARLELENARAKLEHIEGILDKAVVSAPIDGVILHPMESDPRAPADQKEDRLAKGVSLKRGDVLLRIGDLQGLTVVGHVDEVDVSRIRQGHAVRILGDAFPGIELHGEIEQVSSQAVFLQTGSRLPSFEVTAAVNSLTQAQRRVLRLGMSARAEVVVFEKPDALLVPIEAVRFVGAKPRVWVKDPDSGEAREVEVVAGMTTVDSVEILDGLTPGDEVLVGGP